MSRVFIRCKIVNGSKTRPQPIQAADRVNPISARWLVRLQIQRGRDQFDEIRMVWRNGCRGVFANECGEDFFVNDSGLFSRQPLGVGADESGEAGVVRRLCIRLVEQRERWRARPVRRPLEGTKLSSRHGCFDFDREGGVGSCRELGGQLRRCIVFSRVEAKKSVAKDVFEIWVEGDFEIAVFLAVGSGGDEQKCSRGLPRAGDHLGRKGGEVSAHPAVAFVWVPVVTARPGDGGATAESERETVENFLEPDGSV